jgi:HlyD family secretion protein
MQRSLVALLGGGLLFALVAGWTAFALGARTRDEVGRAVEPDVDSDIDVDIDVARTPSIGGSPALGVGAIGRIEPRSRVLELSSPRGASGTPLRSVLVEEGEFVDAGKVLAEFADLDLRRAAVLAAEARLARALRESERIAAGPPREDLAVRDAALRVLELDRALAERNARRARDAWRDDATSATELDTRTAEALRADAMVLEETRRREALAFIDPFDLASAAAEVDAAAAELEQARSDLELSLLRAPIAGRVLAVHARAGEAPDASAGGDSGGGAVLSLADTSAMDVVVEVYESDIGRIAVGLPVSVALPWTETPAAEGSIAHERPLTGVVREIGWKVGRRRLDDPDPIAQDDVRVVEVRATLDAASARRVERMTGLRVRARLGAVAAANATATAGATEHGSDRSAP